MTLLRDEQAFVTTADYFGIWRAIEQLATTSTPGLAIATAIPPGTLPPAVLGVSERTLQRRIAESATSLRELVLETRRELACDYLTQHMPIAEVAYLVGYEDLNSFYRAFRQWEGITPAQWRATKQPRTA